MTPDEQLVADELARLDAIADNPPPGWNDVPDWSAGLNAHLRAYGIRHLPVEAAARILRQEIADALTGRRAPIPRGNAEPVWWLGVTARRAGFSVWTDEPNGLPSGMEVRQHAEAYRRRKARKKPPAGQPGA